MDEDTIVDMVVHEEEEDDANQEDAGAEQAGSSLPVAPTSGQVLQYLESISLYLRNKPDADAARQTVTTIREFTVMKAETSKTCQSKLDFFLK